VFFLMPMAFLITMGYLTITEEALKPETVTFV